jgi:TRAP-type C4-dicarboxylate transport system permease small subunit
VDLPDSLYLLVNYPLLIALPVLLFAGLALWSGSVTAWLAALAWNLYLIYELGMKAEQLCSGLACLRRTPLYAAYPLLGILSLMALVQAYVHIRDRRAP